MNWLELLVKVLIAERIIGFVLFVIFAIAGIWYVLKYPEKFK